MSNEQSVAESLIAACEEVGRFHSIGNNAHTLQARLAYENGALAQEIRNLCRQLDAAKTYAGIVEGITRLPSDHAAMSAVLTAMHLRMEEESGRLGTYGFEPLATCLDDACAAMEECGWADADELAKIKLDVEHQKSIAERHELRGTGLLAKRIGDHR